MTQILRLTGTREQKIQVAQQIKAEFDSTFPELAALRKQLIERDMCADNLSSVARVMTENIDYLKTRDDPDYYTRQFNKPPILTPEISDAIQARTSNPPLPANVVLDSRGRHRRR